MSHSSQHKTSDFLADRHPYSVLGSIQNFAGEIDVLQVSDAYGDRRVPKLVNVLKREDLDLVRRQEALSNLLSLMSDQSHKLEAITHGAVGVLTDGLGAGWTDDPTSTDSSCRIIAACALLLPGRGAVRSSQSVELLSSLLTHNSSDVRHAAALALYNLTIFHDGVTILVKEPASISAVVDSLLDHGKNMTNEVTLCLVGLCANLTLFASGIEKAIQTGMIANLLALLEMSKHNTDIYTEVIKAIWNVSIDDIARQVAIDYGAVRNICRITKETRHPSNEFKRVVSGALLALAQQLEGRKEILEHGIDILSSMVQSENKEVYKNSHAAIILASSIAPVKTAFVKSLVSKREVLLDIYGDTAAQNLNQLLLDNNDNIKADAVVSLERISSSLQGKESLHACLYIVENLIRILINESLSENVKLSAFNTLKSILNFSVSRRIQKMIDKDEKVKNLFTTNSYLSILLEK